MVYFTFRQRCRPYGEYRVNEILKFLLILKEAFGCDRFFDKKGNSVQMTNAYFGSIFEKISSKSPFPETGIDLDLFTIPPSRKEDSTIRIEIHTGTNIGSVFIDFFNVSMGEALSEENLQYLKQSIKVFNPFEAFVAEALNEQQT